MTGENPPAPIRKPRADAERNRKRLLAAAKAAFAEKGTAASLDEIARAAGVGIGTLYRHFPTRDALVAEVYRQEIGQLGKAADLLAETYPPVEALRLWLHLFVDYMAAKQLMAGVLQELAGGTAALYETSGAQLRRSITMLAERAVASGDIRLSLPPFDLLRAVGGVAYASPEPGWEQNARRMVDILIAGLLRGGD